MIRKNIFTAMVIFAVVASAQNIDIQQKLRIAKSYESVQEYEKALEIYRELNNHFPKDYTFIDGIKRNLIALEKYDALVKFLNETIELYENNHNVLGELSKVYYNIGKHGLAKATWERILNIEPKNLFYYTYVADIQFGLRLIDDAINTLLLARENIGDNFTIALKLANFYRWRRNYQNAACEYVKLYHYNNKYYSMVLSAFLSFPDDSATYHQVTGVIGNALNEREDQKLYELLYNYQIKSERYSEAFVVSKKLDKLQNLNGNKLFSFSISAFQEDALMPAKNGFEYIIKNHPNFPRRGQVRFFLVRTVEKMVEQKYFESEPPDKKVTYDDVVEMYRSVAEDFKGQLWEKEALYRIGEINYLVKFDLDEAIKAYSSIIQSSLGTKISVEASIRIGECLIAKGNLSKAQEIFDEKSNLESENFKEIKNKAAFKSVKVDFYFGRFKKTLDKIDKLIESTPPDKNLVNDCLELKMIISENIEKNKNALVMYATAEKLVKQKNYGQALNYLEKIIDNFKDSEISGYALFQMAEISKKIGKYKDSIKYYESLINNYHNSRYFEDAYKNLGIIYSDYLNQKSKAIKIYENFIMEHPNSMYIDYIRKKIRELEKKLETS